MSVYFGLFKTASSVAIPSTPFESSSARLMGEAQSSSIGYQLLGDSGNALRMIDECIEVMELPEAIQVSYLLYLVAAKRVFNDLKNKSSIDIEHDVPEAKEAVMDLMNWVVEHESELVCSHHKGLADKVRQQMSRVEERAAMFNCYDANTLKSQDRVGLFAPMSQRALMSNSAQIDLSMSQR
jgi:hypothetical protein